MALNTGDPRGQTSTTPQKPKTPLAASGLPTPTVSALTYKGDKPIVPPVMVNGAPAAQKVAPAAPKARTQEAVLGIDNQTAAARGLGQGIQNQGQSLFAGQQQAANGFQQQAAGFNPQAQSITGSPAQSSQLAAAAGRTLPAGLGGAPAYNAASALQGVGRVGVQGAPAATPAAQPAFQTGKQVTAGNMGSVANVDPGSLGGYGSVAGGLGSAPGNVSLGAGPGNISLGGAPTVGGVGHVAGRLGAAPQVGNVGNISTGAAPGAVAGTFGDMGMSSGDQQSMMARLNGFLDAPEGPSVAEAQLKQAQADNIGQMIGLARSGRGGVGAQAGALSEAMSQGSALASDTAGQLATLRAQEEDMRKNRALSAIGLGGEMATAARGQDLSFRGQNLSAAQGDQSTALGARGQDLQASMANQSTQTQLEQLRAQTALGARGQDLSALQGDQSTQLGLRGLEANTALGARGQDLQAAMSNRSAACGARGQDLSAAQGNQSTALGARGQDLSALSADVQAQLAARGQNLSALQGNQQAGVTTRGQNIQQEANILGANTALRGQDLQALTGDADRNLAAQQLGLQGQLGFGQLQNQATGMGLQALGQANQQALMGEGMAQDAVNNINQLRQSGWNTQMMTDAGLVQQQMINNAQPSFWEKMALAGVGAAGQAGGGLLANAALMSDVNSKTDIKPLDAIGDHLRGAPGYSYRYKDGVGEDSTVEHAGPMAQDLERSPFGKSLVVQGSDGYKRVNVGRLTLVNHAALSSMRSELDRIQERLGL